VNTQQSITFTVYLIKQQQKFSIMNLLEIKTSIKDISNGHSLTMAILPIWSEIMQKADEVGHFCSDIVEKAVMNHKSISEKQAWCVAYFAKNNGLIK